MGAGQVTPPVECDIAQPRTIVILSGVNVRAADDHEVEGPLPVLPNFWLCRFLHG